MNSRKNEQLYVFYPLTWPQTDGWLHAHNRNAQSTELEFYRKRHRSGTAAQNPRLLNVSQLIVSAHFVYKTRALRFVSRLHGLLNFYWQEKYET